MMEYNSGFADKIRAMIEHRVLRGFKSTPYPQTLKLFDVYCEECCPTATELTHALVHAWLNKANVTPHQMKLRTLVIRQFGLYLSAIGEDAYILPDRFTSYSNRHNPFILTDCELTTLFAAIDSLSEDKAEPFMNEIAPTLFRLTYTCGLRPNEVRELLAEHVYLDSGEILLTHTKRGKERIIVVSDDMLAMCRQYDMRRKIFCAGNPYFFPSYGGAAFTSNKLRNVLNKAWIGAMATPHNPIPHTLRVYDLRHRFASACLNNWLDEGRDLNNMLPYLQEYMGHGSLSETAYYIHILPENLVKSSAIDWNRLNALLPEVNAWPE